VAAYCRVYDSRHLQTDCQDAGSAPEPYALYSSIGYLYLFNGYGMAPLVAGRLVPLAAVKFNTYTSFLLV